jgi:hypothetical protein
MTDQRKPKPIKTTKFTKTVEILANTAPISNKEIVKRSKKSKKI